MPHSPISTISQPQPSPPVPPFHSNPQPSPSPSTTRSHLRPDSQRRQRVARGDASIARLRDAWNGRNVQSPTTTNAQLAATLLLASQQTISDQAWYNYRELIVEIADSCDLPASLPPLPPIKPVAATPAVPSTADSVPDNASSSSSSLMSSASNPPTPAPIESARSHTYTLPASLLPAALRLIILLSTNLPHHYQQIWQKQSAEVAAASAQQFRAIYQRMGVLAMRRLKECRTEMIRAELIAESSSTPPESSTATVSAPEPSATPSAPPGSPASSLAASSRYRLCSRIAALSFHICLSTFYNNPPSESDRAAWWSWMEEEGLANDWILAQLADYDSLPAVMEMWATLLGTETDTDRADRITTRVIRGWKAQAEGTSLSHQSITSKTHDTSCAVHVTPPSLPYHQAISSYTSTLLTVIWQRDKEYAQSNQAETQDSVTQTSDPPGVRTPHVIRWLNEEYRRQLDQSLTKAQLHLSLLPLFAIQGIVNAFDENGPQPQDAALLQPALATPLAETRSLLRRMLDAALNLPEVCALPQKKPNWPCTTADGATCPSCLFVLLTSVAVVHATPILTRSTSEQSMTPMSQPIRITACWLVARAFMQLIDLTWLLRGSIRRMDAGEHKTETSASSIPPVSTDTTATNESAASSIPASLNSSPSSSSSQRSAQLLAFARSPFRALLPQYAVSFGALFIHLNNHEAEHAIMATLWQRIKYIHLAWRWYMLRSNDSSESSTDPAAQSKAINRVRHIAVMQPTDQPISLPDSAQSDIVNGGGGQQATQSNSINAPALSISPVPLPAAHLQQSHDVLFMGIAVVLSRILGDQRWQQVTEPSDVVGAEKLRVEADTDTVALTPTELHHSFMLATIVDILSLMEWTRVAGSFVPYQLLIRRVLALMRGEEIPQTNSGQKKQVTTQPPTQLHSLEWETRASEKRKAFGKVTMAIYLRCFFQHDEHARVQPSDGSTIQPTHHQFSIGENLDPLLGFESMPHRLPSQEKTTQPLAVNDSTSTSTSLAMLFAHSGQPFAPLLLTHPALTMPHPLSTPWPPAFTSLPSRSSVTFNVSDTPWLTRCFFHAGLFESCASNSINWPLRWHLLLPWCWSLRNVPVRALSRRVHTLLATAVIQDGYIQATYGSMEKSGAANPDQMRSKSRLMLRGRSGEKTHTANAVKPGSDVALKVSLSPPFPTIQGAALERFVRTLIPSFTSTLVSLYPSTTSFACVASSLMTVCWCLPVNDLLLLSLLAKLRDRIHAMIRELMEDTNKMKRWRQVLEGINSDNTSTPIMQQDNEDEDSTDDEQQDASERMHPLPPHTRLPRGFPSLNGIRELVFLYLQLMQHVDASLLLPALQLFEELFTVTLSPSISPLSAPLRASLVVMVQQTITGHSFDMRKRQVCVEWLTRLVQQLRIPLAMKQTYSYRPKSVKIDTDRRSHKKGKHAKSGSD